MFVTPTSSQLRIVAAARSLVRRRGYANVSLRDIASAAGYSPAGLYAHFQCRDEILNSVANHVRQQLASALERAVRAEPDPADQLVAAGLAYIGFATKNPAEFELLFSATRSRKMGHNDPTESSFDLLRQISRRYTATASNREIDLFCLGLWSLVHGLASLRSAHLAGMPGEWDSWGREILQAHVVSLRKAPPRPSAANE